MVIAKLNRASPVTKIGDVSVSGLNRAGFFTTISATAQEQRQPRLDRHGEAETRIASHQGGGAAHRERLPACGSFLALTVPSRVRHRPV
jgi:hypothetical protein